VAILSQMLPLHEVGRVLSGDPKDEYCRYLEASVGKLVFACLYLPNGNPYPGPKFDYKLKWFKRLAARAKTLLAHDVPVTLVGDLMYCPPNWTCISQKSILIMHCFEKKSEVLIPDF
jgi:exodeoxyribonuclease-3